jgi:hypothetical protein
MVGGLPVSHRNIVEKLMKSKKKKVIPKKVTKKVIPKKVTKKVIPKKVTKKVIPKKVTKKVAVPIRTKKSKQVRVYPPELMPFPEGFSYLEKDESKYTNEDILDLLYAQVNNVSGKTIASVIRMWDKGKSGRTDIQHFLFTAFLNRDLINAAKTIASVTPIVEPKMLLTHEFFSPGAM